MSRLAPGDELTSKLERAIPIGRFGTVEEIAAIALFLASDAASLIHGATIVADGGAWMASRALIS
jgi:peroxisomal 2,4-dienoyl-CoA reductase